jgi:hypothetical protein
MYHDIAAASLVIERRWSPCCRAESLSGVWRLGTVGLGMGDRSDIGVDLMILLHVVGRPFELERMR